MLASLITVAGGTALAIYMYKRGYRDGYNKGAVDGYSVKK